MIFPQHKMPPAGHRGGLRGFLAQFLLSLQLLDLTESQSLSFYSKLNHRFLCGPDNQPDEASFREGA